MFIKSIMSLSFDLYNDQIKYCLNIYTFVHGVTLPNNLHNLHVTLIADFEKCN